MSEFKREERYYVIKLSDIDGVLDADEREQLAELTDKIEHNRAIKGKIPLKCVCVESDWPIYEPVWSMIQLLAEGQEQKVDEAIDALDRLEIHFPGLEASYNYEVLQKFFAQFRSDGK